MSHAIIKATKQNVDVITFCVYEIKPQCMCYYWFQTNSCLQDNAGMLSGAVLGALVWVGGEASPFPLCSQTVNLVPRRRPPL